MASDLARGAARGMVEGVVSAILPGREGEPPVLELPGWAWGLVAMAAVLALAAMVVGVRWWRRLVC